MPMSASPPNTSASPPGADLPGDASDGLLVTQSGHLNSLWTVTIAIADGTAPVPDEPSPGDATTFAMCHAGLRN